MQSKQNIPSRALSAGCSCWMKSVGSPLHGPMPPLSMAIGVIYTLHLCCQRRSCGWALMRGWREAYRGVDARGPRSLVAPKDVHCEGFPLFWGQRCVSGNPPLVSHGSAVAVVASPVLPSAEGSDASRRPADRPAPYQGPQREKLFEFGVEQAAERRAAHRKLGGRLPRASACGVTAHSWIPYSLLR